jgi:hypothetical protein
VPLQTVMEKKFLDICDFVNMLAPVVEDTISLNNEQGTQMILRSGKKRPSIDHITVEEWCAGNTRIMNELLDSGELNIKTMKDYMGYTVKVL